MEEVSCSSSSTNTCTATNTQPTATAILTFLATCHVLSAITQFVDVKVKKRWKGVPKYSRCTIPDTVPRTGVLISP
jgi:hypothetical protein